MNETKFDTRVAELWTASQRQMHSLHYVISYRASFKPELPDYFIKKYSNPGEIIFDPFSGRGTTALQANLLGRVAFATDVNPLSVKITKAKTTPVSLDSVKERLSQLNLGDDQIDTAELTAELSNVQSDFQRRFFPFYHPSTFSEIVNLKTIIKKFPDSINNFIELLALSRLHGHSDGFFSVYSFPQLSIPPKQQHENNMRRALVPEYKELPSRIIKKARLSLRDPLPANFLSLAAQNKIQVSDSRSLDWIEGQSVDLIITSPPFLDKVDYLKDNWISLWFAGIDAASVKENIGVFSSLDSWREFIRQSLCEMLRILKPDRRAVIEVGEVTVKNGGKIFLDEIVINEAQTINNSKRKFIVEELLINQQQFTKLSNCFNVSNNVKGTNTNRLVILKCVAY